MTIKELINKLTAMPQDALVVTEGYEDGYDTHYVETHGRASLQKGWWVGKYINSTDSRSMNVVLLYSGTKEDNK